MTNEHDTPEADLDATMIAEVRKWRERQNIDPDSTTGHRWEMRLMLAEVDALLRAAAERDELKAVMADEFDRVVDDMRREAREVNAAADFEPEIPATQLPQTHAPWPHPCRLCMHSHPVGVLCAVIVSDRAGIPRTCECTA